MSRKMAAILSWPQCVDIDPVREKVSYQNKWEGDFNLLQWISVKKLYVWNEKKFYMFL